MVNQVLYEYGLTNYDVNYLREIFPVLDNLNEKRLRENIELLIRKGYPSDEIYSLIIANPSWLAYENKSLENKLNLIAKGKSDLYLLLKSYPNLI